MCAFPSRTRARSAAAWHWPADTPPKRQAARTRSSQHLSKRKAAPPLPSLFVASSVGSVGRALLAALSLEKLRAPPAQLLRRALRLCRCSSWCHSGRRRCCACAARCHRRACIAPSLRLGVQRLHLRSGCQLRPLPRLHLLCHGGKVRCLHGSRFWPRLAAAGLGFRASRTHGSVWHHPWRRRPRPGSGKHAGHSEHGHGGAWQAPGRRSSVGQRARWQRSCRSRRGWRSGRGGTGQEWARRRCWRYRHRRCGRQLGSSIWCDRNARRSHGREVGLRLRACPPTPTRVLVRVHRLAAGGAVLRAPASGPQRSLAPSCHPISGRTGARAYLLLLQPRTQAVKVENVATR